jgi:DNA-directed RNA polymerase specialized sigma24 family protein
MFAISPRQEAEALADANYEALKEVVLRSVRSRLFARGVRLDRIDLEEAYNLAWHGVCQVISQGRRVGNLPGLLVDITGKRAIDIYRQRNEAMFADGADVEGHAVEIDLAERVDDREKIVGLVGRLKGRLSDVQRNAVTLCLLHGYTRPEAARMLGIEPAAFEKVMDRATKKISGVIAAMDGRGCGGDEWARALRSFALGVTGRDSPDYERVAEHLRECGSCERYVVGLRGLAAVLPPLGLPLAPAGHGVGGLLASLHRLLAPHGSAGAGAAGVQASATVASSTASSAAAAGGGGWAALGGGVAKVAVAAGVATVGALSVHALAVHHPHRRAPTVVAGRRDVAGPAGVASVSVGVEPSGQASETERPESPVVHPAPTVRHAVAVVAEFGVERHPRRADAIAAAAAAPAPIPASRSVPVAETASVSQPAHTQAEFGFEH